MAGSLNRVTLIGNVGKDPEIRTLPGGDRVANLSVATSESWTSKSGERQERTEWFRIACFNDRLADVIEKYVRKGAKIFIEGSLQTRKYTDQSGTERYSTEVVLSRFNGQLIMLGGGADRDGAAPTRAAVPAERSYSAAPTSRDEMNDEIPF